MNSTLRNWAAATVWLLAAALHAAEPRLLYSLVVPTITAEPGSTIEVQLAVLNRSSTAVAVALPSTVSGFVASPAGRWAVSLQSRDAAPPTPPMIAPGAFALGTYAMTVPAEVTPGMATLEIAPAEAAWSRGVLDIATAPKPDRASGARTQRPTTTLARAEPAAAALRRMFADRLAPHEPIYFIYGADDPVAKFQFSFKYKLLDFRDVAPQRMSRALHFAFTQRSLWDIKGASSPFYDTSYMPEIIYESLAPKPEESDRWFTWLGYQAAYKHESNGRDGPTSRSLNVAYVRPVFAFGQLDGWHLLVMPELFTYVTTREENPDIEDYRGFARLHLVLGRNDGPSLMASLWAGDDFQNVTTQIDLTLPIRTQLLNFETYFLVQYFNGYGESLLSYRDRSETVRAGISFVR